MCLETTTLALKHSHTGAVPQGQGGSCPYYFQNKKKEKDRRKKGENQEKMRDKNNIKKKKKTSMQLTNGSNLMSF